MFVLEADGDQDDLTEDEVRAGTAATVGTAGKGSAVRGAGLPGENTYSHQTPSGAEPEILSTKNGRCLREP